MTRVLIVDDEPDMLLLLRLNLEREGFETGLAADGDEALRRLRTERFDVVLLDIMMPVLDGFGVLDALKGDPDSPPVVVLTANPAFEERVMALGARAFVEKPPDFLSLPSQLRAVAKQ